MIAYIQGKLTLKNPTHVYIESNGIGYHVNISLHTFGQIENLESTKLWIHHHITDSDQSLFGFNDELERGIFKHLISVSGIGPSTARMACSYMHPTEIKTAIVQDNVQMVSKIKGIGPKTAKRIILDLKDKLIKEGDDVLLNVNTHDTSIRAEALSALTALGFQKGKIGAKVDEIIRSEGAEASVESVIKTVLRQLS